jgi:NAD(P)H-dependent FMN reductase
MKKILVVVGSVRKNRKADLILPLVKEVLEKHPDLEVDIADLKDVQLPFFDHPASPMMPGFMPDDPEAAKWVKRVDAADGFIFMTPEYNHSTTGALKNAIDWVYHGWVGKPVAFVSWGVQSGVRAVEHLRQIVLWPHMKPLRTATYIPIFSAFDQDGKLADESVHTNIERTVQELKEAVAA